MDSGWGWRSKTSSRRGVTFKQHQKSWDVTWMLHASMSWRHVTSFIPTSSRFAGFPRYKHPRGLSESLIFHAVSPLVILAGWSGWLREFLFSIPSCLLAHGCVILLSVLKRMRRMCFTTIKKLTRLWWCRSVGGILPFRCLWRPFAELEG